MYSMYFTDLFFGGGVIFFSHIDNILLWLWAALFFHSLQDFHISLICSLSLEYGWQQVSSGLQYSSQCSWQSQQCYSVYGLDSSFLFQFLLSFFQTFWDGPKCSL